MTLNGVIALILRYFTEFDSFGGRLCHSGLVEDRLVMSVECRLPLLAKTDHPAARSFYDS